MKYASAPPARKRLFEQSGPCRKRRRLVFVFVLALRCLRKRGSGWRRISRRGRCPGRLQEFGRDLEDDAHGFAAAAIQLLNIGGLQDFKVCLTEGRIELFGGFAIAQTHLREHYDATKHFFEAADGSLRRALSIDDHAQQVSFGLSADRDPLQLAEQGSELRRSEAAGRTLSEIVPGFRIFAQHSEDGSASETEEMLAPIGGSKSGTRLREVSSFIGPSEAVVAQERKESGA